MVIQRVWALIIGIASATIGVLKFISIVNIPKSDALIHIITGMFFIAGAWIQKGKYVIVTNLSLGIFYIIFGAIGFYWPHIIAGIISLIIALTIRPGK